MGVLSPHGEVAKVFFPVARLATHKHHVYVYAVVGLELIATILADKHIATLLPNLALVGRWQRLESLVTYITEVAHSLSCVLYFFAPPASSSSQPQVTVLAVSLSPSPTLIPSSDS